MAEHKNNFLPISEIDTDRLKAAIPFPGHAPVNKIGLHQKRLERLCNLGGIRHLTIIGRYDGEVSQETPLVAGFTSGGEVLAAKQATKTIASSYTNIPEPLPFSALSAPRAALWTNNIVALNLNEINQRIQSDSRFEGVRSAQAWAHHLDKPIRDAISEIGIKNLVGFRSGRFDHLLFSFLNTFSITSSARSNLHPVEGLLWVLAYNFVPNLFHGIVWEAAMRKVRKVNPEIQTDPYRLSLFFGLQPDRALLLKALTSTQKLIKPID